jgi:hypothetical protein
MRKHLIDLDQQIAARDQSINSVSCSFISKTLYSPRPEER